VPVPIRRMAGGGRGKAGVEYGVNQAKTATSERRDGGGVWYLYRNNSVT